MQLEYRRDIDGLRAFAVLSVVVFHAFPDAIPGGFVGVDVFFVISGYLITGILLKELNSGTFSFRDFYSRRIRRIFPALILVLLSCLVAGWFLLTPSEYKLLGKHTAGAAGFMSNLVFLKEAGYFDVDSGLKPLLHLWSLGVEEQFYIVWPFILLMAWRRNYLRYALPVVIALSLSVNIAFIAEKPDFSFYHPMSRFWELAAGGGLAYWQSCAPLRQSIIKSLGIKIENILTGMVAKEVISVVSLLFLIGSIIFIDETSGFPGWVAIAPVLGAFLFISVGADAWVNKFIFSSRWVVFVGLVSYPFYLWHWPLLVFARIFNEGEPGSFVRFGLLIAAFCFALLTYIFIEKKVRNLNVKYSIHAVILLMSVLLVFGLVTNNNNGFSFRYPAEIRAIVDYEYNGKKEARTGRCFMKTEQGHEDFSGECAIGANDKGRPTVFLWGDSHAAHLYPGLHRREVESGLFNVFQYTSSGCPPILSMAVSNRKKCISTNNYVIEKIKELKPDVVVVAGYWVLYDGNDGWNKLELDRLLGTIEKIREVGIKEIVVVGSVPLWDEPQPKIILKEWENFGRIKKRTSYLLGETSFIVDKAVGDAVKGAGIDFLSPLAGW